MRTDSALENALQIANQRQPDSASRFELCVLYLEPFAGSLTSLSIDFLATSLDHYLSSSLALLLTCYPNGSLSGSLLSISCLFHYLAHCSLTGAFIMWQGVACGVCIDRGESASDCSVAARERLP